jgi:uncharacterized protein
MRKLWLASVIFLVICIPSLGQQNPADAPATQADVEKYLEVMHSRQMMNQMVEAMAKPMDKMIHDEYLKHKDILPPDYESHMTKMTHDMLADIPWEQLIQATMPAYQKHFTKGDLDALTAFYSTPTGQKILREMPGLMADSMEIMMPLMQQHVEKVSSRMHEELTAMLKQAKKPSSSPETSEENKK